MANAQHPAGCLDSKDGTEHPGQACLSRCPDTTLSPPVWAKSSLWPALFVVLLLFCLSKLPVSSFDRSSDTRPQVIFADMKLLSKAIKAYYHDCGQWPTEERGLAVLFEDPARAGWSGPYIGRLDNIYDSYGNLFLIKHVKGGCVIISPGADSIYGTHDDIKSSIISP
ncbi:MAG: type II secretion system protein GspG [Deltaproteobacteria bacterium]